MKSLQKFSIHKRYVYLSLTIILILLAVLSVSLGAVSISFKEILTLISGGDIKTSHRSIILYTRIPRTIACILVGSALSVSGVIIQSVLDNPLSAPNIIGVNSGAGFFVLLCSAIFPTMVYLRPIFAFLGALTAVFTVLLISEKSGSSKLTLILTGVAVSGIFTAGTDFIISVDSDASSGYTDFKIGSFSGISMKNLYLPIVVIVVCLVISLLLTNELDVLSLGHDTAFSLGLDAKKMRNIFLIISSALAASAVAVSGVIGFVGLLVPHALRRLVGSEAKPLIISSILGGASLTLGADLISRLLFAPDELPVGILLSLIGGIFFILLLLKQRKGRIHD